MISRRRFLATAGLATGAIALPGLARAQAPATTSPNDRLRLAFIGVGGRGGANLRELTSQGDEVVAICDVDQRHLDRAATQFPQAKSFRDFRALYDEFQEFDAVVVSTPEHTHAYAMLPALRLGKHVYCEKPLTHNIREARLIAEAAREAGVATQMGTQIHATPNYRQVVELIRTGAIGPVREAHVWVSRAWGLQSEEEAKQHNDIVYVTGRPAEGMTPPPYLDWDLWLGPAAERPFHEVYFPGPKWYRWWDWGSGTMSDLGSHWNDLPFWALELDAPLTVSADGPEPHPELAPASMSATYEYGPRGDMPACTVHWHQGSHKPQIWRDGGIPQWANGVLFIGDKGMLLADYGKYVLLPEADFTGFEPPEPFLPESPGQHAEWLNGCRNGTPTGSPFDYAAALTEANHLGNVAFRDGGKIAWDRQNLKIPNRPDAERLLGRESPRDGWTLA
ncbi:MAG: Gfo/Idh/MocA family oxidoreductase [Planctomycetaceae bacterium]|nr:Gfo/Idh/MocA family oxidoreductase [Planctomycetaceae bacterium]